MGLSTGEHDPYINTADIIANVELKTEAAATLKKNDVPVILKSRIKNKAGTDTVFSTKTMNLISQQTVATSEYEIVRIGNPPLKVEVITTKEALKTIMADAGRKK